MDNVLSVNTLIHPLDEMYLTALSGLKNSGLAKAMYYKQGGEINDSIQQLLEWRFGAEKVAAKFLDFACGYGRSTRFLVREIPPQNIWVSDIYAEAVTFQRDTFGVNGFTSCHEPFELDCESDFDMIFVASLFSHLPAEPFKRWLQRLFELLAPSGILVFSVHDEALAGGQVMPGSGILFVEASESRTLSKSEYGSTYVTEPFVRSSIHAVAGPNWRYKRLVRALCGAQDIYIVSKDPNQSFVSLEYQHPPVGYVDWFKISDSGELRIGGWAGEPNDGVDLKAIRVTIGGKTIMASKPSLARDDVAKVLGNEKFAFSGWECIHPIEDVNSNLDVTIEVTAISENGSSSLLHFSPLSAGVSIETDGKSGRPAPPGVNVFGHAMSEKGVGEALVSVRSLNAAAVPHVVIDFPDPGSANNDRTVLNFLGDNPHPINLIHVNADLVPSLLNAFG